uniref:Uncharacterized protein n=1 Tax=Arundo donax TaxID=35708 RepID=A0A0A8XZ09_ARUDO
MTWCKKKGKSKNFPKCQ